MISKENDENDRMMCLIHRPSRAIRFDKRRKLLKTRDVMMSGPLL